MRRRPVVTMLSGPAASVAGALMYLRVSDGIYFEVGGTSTNIGVIRNGRPTVKYARVGGHETYVNSLDVRVIGIAGGSMVRVRDGKLVDVGPRSAHIAGLPYAAFAKPEDIVDPADRVLPAEGRRSRRLRRDPLGERHALCHHQHLRRQRTRLCQARTACQRQRGIGAARDGAARTASSARAIEDTARAILEIATDKVIPVVDDLIAEYKLDRDQALLVGEGGGAAALIPHASSAHRASPEISQDAEVISSIGVALALVREMVERVIPNPTPEDLQRIKREAFDAVVKLGAAPENVEVTIEVDPKTHRVRATAMGASEMRARQRKDEVGENEARDIAAKSMGLSPSASRSPRPRRTCACSRARSRSASGASSRRAAARCARSISKA